MLEQLEQFKTQADKAITSANTLQELRDVEVHFLGRRGKLALLLQQLRDLPQEERPAAGARANELKKDLIAALAHRAESLKGGTPASTSHVLDITWPGERMPYGHIHPLTRFLRLVTSIFSSMGFEIIEGPEVESTKYNFDLLNIPKDHPARDVWDTFFVRSPEGVKSAEGDLVLRTHTSPMQVRAMETRTPPVRFIVPGRVYRHEATDASHEAMFYQCEGLVIDRGIRVTDLLGTLKIFLQTLFEKKVKIRVRPEFYPFVEPGLDIDMSCLLCDGKGCPACKQSGWMEMMGSGMVHPKVLTNMGVDPKVYSGFAFGLGIDRLMMLYFGIDDVRLSYQSDMRFLEQF